jgi:mono/diheme cytochrome c family protein
VKRALLGAAAFAALLVTANADAIPGTDLHAYWDDRCQSCHGDSGPFARRTLALRDGRLIGRHHVDDLPRFLRQHYLADALVAPVSAMLAAQVATSPLYAAHCAGCHGVASAFAACRAGPARRSARGAARGRTLEAVLGPRRPRARRATHGNASRPWLRVRREVGG